MGRRPDRYRYGPRGEYRGSSSDDDPLTKLVKQVFGALVLGFLVWLWLRGCR